MLPGAILASVDVLTSVADQTLEHTREGRLIICLGSADGRQCVNAKSRVGKAAHVSPVCHIIMNYPVSVQAAATPAMRKR